VIRCKLKMLDIVYKMTALYDAGVASALTLVAGFDVGST